MPSDKYREKMQRLYEESKRRGGGSSEAFPDGQSTWRFLPYGTDKDGDPVTFFRHAQHYLAGDYIPCSRELTDGQCPVCAFAERYYNDADSKRRAVARAMAVRIDYRVNAIQIGDDDKPTGTVRVLRVPKGVFSQVMECYTTKKWGDVLSPMSGVPFSVTRKKTGPNTMDVDYSAQPLPDRGPISKDPNVMKKLRAEVINLEEAFSGVFDEDKALAAIEKAKRDTDFVTKAMEDQRRFESRRQKQGGKRG